MLQEKIKVIDQLVKDGDGVLDREREVKTVQQIDAMCDSVEGLETQQHHHEQQIKENDK